MIVAADTTPTQETRTSVVPVQRQEATIRGSPVVVWEVRMILLVRHFQACQSFGGSDTRQTS